jgi:hypothetical protein
VIAKVLQAQDFGHIQVGMGKKVKGMNQFNIFDICNCMKNQRVGPLDID